MSGMQVFAHSYVMSLICDKSLLVARAELKAWCASASTRSRLWPVIGLCGSHSGKVCAYSAVSVRAIDSDLDIDASNADIAEVRQPRRMIYGY
ncbi:hypothetical protein J3A98_004678 [Pseudomonas sp. BP6]|nr:hypothetical protein [Pseudomonas sp. BP6]MBP2287044.1 hypothetical protein [Pseudomonas sp. BP7]